MTLSIDEQIKGLGDTISSAQWHFDIWEALDEARGDLENVKVFNKYLEFFRATVTANFESYIISCYQLFETRSDTISFPGLKSELKSSVGLDVDADVEAIRLQDSMKPIWIKINRLRNESIGHLSRDKTLEKIYAEADMRPEQIRQFIEMAKALYNNITYRRSQALDPFNIRGKASVKQIFDDLQKQL